MKRLLLAAALLALAACSRHKIIPDRELALIFHDAFLTNAYAGSSNLRLDSLNLYEPIFADYGYTTRDVQYTIGNFSKRKSARLSDVVEEAIRLLEAEGRHWVREVAVLDTIDQVALRSAARIVRADSLIRVRSLRDTARLDFSFDVEPGQYDVSLNYLIDSLDRNEKGIRARLWLDRTNGNRSNLYTVTLRRHREEPIVRRFTTDTVHRRLRISLLNFNETPRRPSITVRDFTVRYTPPLDEAVEALYERQMNVRIFADDFAAAPRDTLAPQPATLP